MELGELFRTLGPTLVAVAPHVKKGALYMLIRRNASIEYEERFRELLAFTREDVGALIRGVEECGELCRRFGVDTEERGSLYRIDVRLDWYLAYRQGRILRRILNLADEFRSSVAGIADVIACFSGLTGSVEQGAASIGEGEYEDYESIQHLSSVEEQLQKVLENRDSSIDEFMALAMRFLLACDGVLDEFTEGIGVGSSSRTPSGR